MSESRSFEEKPSMPFIMYYYIIQGGCESGDTLVPHSDRFTFRESRRLLLQVYMRAAMHGLYSLEVDYPTCLKLPSGTAGSLFA